MRPTYDIFAEDRAPSPERLLAEDARSGLTV